jgi:hypothetical protein
VIKDQVIMRWPFTKYWIHKDPQSYAMKTHKVPGTPVFTATTLHQGPLQRATTHPPIFSAQQSNPADLLAAMAQSKAHTWFTYTQRFTKLLTHQ